MPQINAVANVLSIAGSDPSGGAGIQADLKTFAALGCYGMAAISALTVQNTQGVLAMHLVAPDILEAQIEAIFADIRVDAVKIGMLGSTENVAVVAAVLKRWKPVHVVLDPVLAATSGAALGSAGLAQALVHQLFPLATLVTPNLPEARLLAGREGTALELAEALYAAGGPALLVKGGHAEGAEACDWLVDGQGAARFCMPRLATRNTHGTGCTLASALAAALACGLSLRDAVAAARHHLQCALAGAEGLAVGAGTGHGPLNHFAMQNC